MTDISNNFYHIDQARQPKCNTTKTPINGGDVKFTMTYYYTLSVDGQPEEESIFTAKGRLPQNDHSLLAIDEFTLESGANKNDTQDDFIEIVRKLV